MPAASALVETGAALVRLATGFGFTEGPVWNPDERSLIFSDIPGNRMHRWSETDGVTVFREPSNKANGSCYDLEGALLTCEHVTSRVVRQEPDGRLCVVASHWAGKALNSPNDVIVRSDGTIFFTDPTYGRTEGFGLLREPELGFRGVYALAPNGVLTLVASDFGQPNGLCLSLDETVLWVNDTETSEIRRFAIVDGGIYRDSGVRAVVAGPGDGVPDGMKIDARDRLFCTGPGGIHVFDAELQTIGVIPVPEVVGNFTWGGDDMRTLFVTASQSLYAARMAVPGVRLFPPRRAELKQ